MRKIESKETMEKKSKRSQLIIGVILIFVMITSTLGFVFMSRDNSGQGVNLNEVEYNGYTFVGNGGMWRMEIEGQVFDTFYTPESTENISLTENIDYNYFLNDKIYYVEDNPRAIAEMRYNLERFSAYYFQEVCLAMNKYIEIEVENEEYDENNLTSGVSETIIQREIVNTTYIGDCEDDTLVRSCDSKVIVFEKAEEVDISMEDNCLFVRAPYQEQVLIADRIIFKSLGIQY